MYLCVVVNFLLTECFTQLQKLQFSIQCCPNLLHIVSLLKVIFLRMSTVFYTLDQLVESLKFNAENKL